jgi:FMN-dependent NADH-azoreductase
MAKKNFLNEKIFGDKTISDLYQEAHDDINDTKEQLQATLAEAIPQIKDKQDVLMLLPLINNLFANSVKNSANLIKIAEILTKTFSQKENEDGDIGKKSNVDDTDELWKEMDAILKAKKDSNKLLLN